MADVVTTQILENGPRNVVMKFTNESDGTGETAVTKVNATSSGSLGVVYQGQTFYPGVHLKVVGIEYDIKSMGLRIQWNARPDADMMVLGGFGTKDFRSFGGLFVPSGLTSPTGSIDFTTVNANLGASYLVILRMRKGVPQS